MADGQNASGRPGPGRRPGLGRPSGPRAPVGGAGLVRAGGLAGHRRRAYYGPGSGFSDWSRKKPIRSFLVLINMINCPEPSWIEEKRTCLVGIFTGPQKKYGNRSPSPARAAGGRVRRLLGAPAPAAAGPVRWGIGGVPPAAPSEGPFSERPFPRRPVGAGSAGTNGRPGPAAGSPGGPPAASSAFSVRRLARTGVPPPPAFPRRRRGGVFQASPADVSHFNKCLKFLISFYTLLIQLTRQISQYASYLSCNKVYFAHKLY
jgi:hypothetical protein